jgi:hypothetical protein
MNIVLISLGQISKISNKKSYLGCNYLFLKSFKCQYWNSILYENVKVSLPNRNP